jgi:tetratricopeptide (TPR) repeat protein
LPWWIRDLRVFVVIVLLLAPRSLVEQAPVLRTGGADPEAIVPTIALDLTLPASEERFRWEAETIGLIALLLEAGLGDLRGVVPRLGARPVSPGLADAAPLTITRWTGALIVSGAPDGLRVALELCPPDGPCTTDAAIGTQSDPAAAVARVVQAASVRMQRGRVGLPRTAKRSRDDYAQLITGRAGAIGYGLLPPTPPEVVGDRRRDPAFRAAYIDPTVAEAWWEQGRQAVEPEVAAAAFVRAAALEPSSTLRLADQAATTLSCAAAWPMWQEVNARAAREARFSIPRARVALCAGDLDGAGVALSRITQEGVAEVDALRVALAEARGPGDDYDLLLSRWQASSPVDPEPLRRRIQLRIRRGALADALGLTPELAARGVPEEASNLNLALSANLGDQDAAAAAAEAAGRPDDVWRLRAAGGDVGLPLPAAPQPSDLAGRGWLLLGAGDAGGALAAAESALAEAPWMPEAIALQVRALEALGRGEEATAARRRLLRVDPGSQG